MNDIPDPHDKTLSRTQRKLASQTLQKLGLDITKLPASIRHTLPLNEILRHELERLRTTTNNVAKKRQMQFVGKLLRREDPEPLLTALRNYEQRGQEQTARQHRAERWRDYLLSQGDEAIHNLLQQHPELDRQTLRQLVRQSHLETANKKPPSASRKLFRLLHKRDLERALPVLQIDSEGQTTLASNLSTTDR